MKTWHGALFATAFLCMAIAPLETAHADQAHAHGHKTAPKAAELGTTAAFDGQGRLWAVNKELTEDGKPYLALRASDDQGQTWSALRQLVQEPVAARGDERPKIAFGNRGELYIVYTRPRPNSPNPHIGDIRFIASEDGGKNFSEPITVHANRDVITHAFGTLIVDKAGNIYVAWIDGRGREAAKAMQEKYAGNAIYYAVSSDGGKSFRGDYKIADNACECCRISLAVDHQGKPVAMWRHIFEPNIRDHAIAELTQTGRAANIVHATFDDWKIDACPHQGPAVAYGANGIRHQVWFTGKETRPTGVLYAAAGNNGRLSEPVVLGSEQAAHADVAVQGDAVSIVWKQFDGNSTAILGRFSNDGGQSWSETELARTSGESDKPYLIKNGSGILLVWHTRADGIQVIPVAKAKS